MQVVQQGVGLSREGFDALKGNEHPSMTPVNEYSTKSTFGAFIVDIEGVVSHVNDEPLTYKTLVDARHFPRLPTALIMVPHTDDIQHVNVHVGRSEPIVAGLILSTICLGEPFEEHWKKNWQGKTEHSDKKMSVFLEQLQHVLRHPNPGDIAREV